MKINKQIGNRGFTLVELMIVIVIIGVLAALASFGFIEYVKKSKSAEADEFVKKIGDGAKIYYTSEQKCGGDEVWHPNSDCGTSGAEGYPVTFENKVFCGGSGAKVMTMAAPPSGGGKSLPVLSGTGANSSTAAQIFKCLNFSTADPTYFQYLYDSDSAGTAATAVVAAQADFDSTGTAATDATTAKANTDNQVLYKTLSISNGDVAMTPAVLKNQGK